MLDFAQFFHGVRRRRTDDDQVRRLADAHGVSLEKAEEMIAAQKRDWLETAASHRKAH